MFKRRHWVFHKGSDEDSSDGDSGEEAEPSDDTAGGEVAERAAPRQGAANSDEQDEEGAAGEGSDSEDDGPALEELEALYHEQLREEAGYTGSKRSRRQRQAVADTDGLSAQVESWLTSGDADCSAGHPLRCMLCKGVLLLNSRTFQQHLSSKRHVRAAKRCGVTDPADQLDHIVLAAAVSQGDLEGETHDERLQRLQQVAPGRGAEPGLSGSEGAEGGKKRKRKKAAGGSRPGKPGRRQRQAMKAAKAGELAA